ncbi:MAG: prephenate dehydrogenase/arogenate dehydrogenase family protein [Ignavibacteriaceae bacterium]|nr:prephenate dehydrogenase/arogenate dehydrogenase family protein [Ignavibacteriaceae bacterium]
MDKNAAVQAELKVRDYSELKEAEYIFFAVPISALEPLLMEIQQYISGSAVLADVCSVKEYPLEVMKKYFPRNEIIGTHPLFGPDSTADGLAGRQMVMTPSAQTPAYIRLSSIFRSAGLEIITMTAEEHDRQMAWTLCLTQFIGRGLGSLPLPRNSIGTRGYFDLLDIVTRSNADTMQLYIDMNKYNRFAGEMRESVIKGLADIHKQL